MLYTKGISKKAKTIVALILLEFREKEKDIELYCHVNYMFIKKSGLLKTLSCKPRYYGYFISSKTLCKIGLKLKIITYYKKRKQEYPTFLNVLEQFLKSGKKYIPTTVFDITEFLLMSFVYFRC